MHKNQLSEGFIRTASLVARRAQNGQGLTGHYYTRLELDILQCEVTTPFLIKLVNQAIFQAADFSTIRAWIMDQHNDNKSTTMAQNILFDQKQYNIKTSQNYECQHNSLRRLSTDDNNLELTNVD